jgi:predicted ATPase
LIEEPEVCVHHGLLASIVELIKSQSAEKQIIFSTHSDFVLDQVNPDQVFSTMSRVKKGTVVRSLAKDYPKQTIEALRDFLRTSGNLGEFWRQGGFDY